MTETYDVIVVGSGGAALSAASVAAHAGRSVLILERAAQLGGTTAFSGGMMWIPGNPHFGERGGQDTAGAARAYIRGLTQGRQYDDELIDVFIEEGPRAVDHIERITPLRLHASRTYTDYYADREGGTGGGRSVIPEPLPARHLLGDWFDQVRESPHLAFPLTLDEMVSADPRNMYAATRAADDLPRLAAERTREGVVANGRALVCGLLAGALAHGATVRTSARVTALTTESGAVTGVSCADGARYEARHGVILGSGGFEWDAGLVRAFLGFTDVTPLSPPGNEGDALRMGMAIGAGLANMYAGWNYPCTLDPSASYEGRPRATFGSTRFEKGCIAVNRQGRRFVNEGAQYDDVPKAFWRYDEATQSYPNQPPAFLIFDQAVRDRAVVADMRPDAPTPAWVTQADSLAELAASLGIDARGLLDEVERFNANARRGVDPDFGRGTVWFEGFSSGGPSPEAGLATIEKPPYYAMQLRHGLLGTAGGLRVNAGAQVVSAAGAPIGGLYACGNAAASIFGPMYPGGGTSIGLGITFGYLAGLSASGQR